MLRSHLLSLNNQLYLRPYLAQYVLLYAGSRVELLVLMHGLLAAYELVRQTPSGTSQHANAAGALFGVIVSCINFTAGSLWIVRKTTAVCAGR